MGASDHRLISEIVTAINNCEGWRCGRGKGKWVIYPPDKGPILQIPLTPSDRRWLQNTAAALRRRGWPEDVPIPGTRPRPRR